MSCWDILKIEPTNIEKDIKIAYAKLLKQKRPEDDPKSFMELRASYEQAIKLAKSLKTEAPMNIEADQVQVDNNGETSIQSQDRYNLEVNKNDDKGIYSQVDSIIQDINQCYQDYIKRVDINHWTGVINSIKNASIQLKEELFLPIAEFLTQNTHVPSMLYEILNKQFEYTQNEQILIRELGEQATDLLMDKCYNGRFYYNQNIPEGLKEEDIDEYLALRDRLLYDTSLADVDNIVKSLRSMAKEDYLVDFALGMINFNKLKFNKADELYQKAAKNCENQLTLLLHGGYASLRKRNIDEAVEIFSGLMELHSDNPHCIKGLAMCYYHKEKYYEAIILFEVLLDQIPYDFYCKTYIGLCYNAIFQDLRGKDISELNKDQCILMCKRYMNLERYSQAYKYIAPIRHNLDTSQKLLLAQVAEHIEDITAEEYIENYNDVIKDYEIENINPYELYVKMAQIYYYDVYREKDDRIGLDKAIDMCNKSIALMPDSAEAYYYLCVCYGNGYENYAKSLEYIEKAISIDRNAQKYYYSRGMINKLLENYREAIKDFDYIIEHNYGNGNDGAAAYSCAECYYYLKDYEKAMKYINDAKRLEYKKEQLYELEKAINERKSKKDNLDKKPLIKRLFSKLFK